MLNLLFISDSPKVEFIKKELQPVLKVIIDVVTDFDHGLKDVFEKRPATVCIQDHIGGVTGESVARHIQMLLGNSAPTFILLYAGNDKPRTIKGLYEHLIDLNQSNDAVAEELKNTLKLLLGDQWERIHIPPRQTPASGRATVAVPEESREDADRLVDDFLSDLEKSGSSMIDEQPPAVSVGRKSAKNTAAAPQTEPPWKSGHSSGTAESDRANAINDDLTELLLMEASKARRDERPAAASSAVVEEAEPVSADLPAPAATAVKPPPPVAAEPPAPAGMVNAKTTRSSQSTSSSPGNVATLTASAPAALTSPPAAADFRISQHPPREEDHIPEELLLSFEESYRSESRFVQRAVVVALVSAAVAAGGWFLIKQKPQLASSLKERFVPTSASIQAPAAPPATLPVQKPVPPPVPTQVTPPPLPAFVPKEGHDSAYTGKNPGWERYVGKHAEFRLFTASGRIQALQVLGVHDAPVPDSLIKSVLKEFAGNSEYQITSRNTKAGIRVENGRIQNRGEIVIYRKNGNVKAFVVSVNP